MHVTDDRVLAVSPAVTAALAQSKAVALEVADLSAAANSAAMAKAAGLVMFTDGRRLDRMVSAEEYEKLKASLARAGMPSETAVLFRPWIAYLILSVPECERRKVRDGQLVLDMRLAEEAKARKIPVVGLETIEQQLAALAAVPEEQQLDMLRATLRYIDRSDDLMETMLQLYLRREMGAAWPCSECWRARRASRIPRTPASRRSSSTTATCACATPRCRCWRRAARSSPWRAAPSRRHWSREAAARGGVYRHAGGVTRAALPHI